MTIKHEVIPVDEPGAEAAKTPIDRLARALENGVDVAALEKFMDLQERWEASEAKKAYAAAMVKCQQEMPPIAAKSVNMQTKSLYAKLAAINAAIKPVYTAAGFSISFGEEPIDGGEVRIKATVLHEAGHSEPFILDLPLDIAGLRGSENKTAIHAKGSTTTYGCRRLVTMIFNLTVGDDVDGNVPGQAATDPDTALELSALVTDWGLKEGPILREFGVKAWEDLPSSMVDKAKARIKQIGQARQKK